MKKVLLLCMLAGSAYGEPTQATWWLINEPVSMLEWGMYKLDLTLDIFAQEAVSTATGTEAGFSVQYSEERNRLIIRAGLELEKDDQSSMSSEERIRKAVSELRRSLVEIERGDTTSFLLENAFTHHAFRRASQPDNLVRELIGLTELEVSCRTYYNGPYLEATAPLLGTDIFFKASD